MEYNTLNFLLTLIIKGIFVSIITVSFFAFVIMMNSIYKTREEEENERKRELLYGKTSFEPIKHERVVEEEKMKISPIHEDNLLPATHDINSFGLSYSSNSNKEVNPINQVRIKSSIIPEQVSIHDLYDKVKKNQPRTSWSDRLKKDDDYDQLRSEIKAYTNLIEKEKII